MIILSTPMTEGEIGPREIKHLDPVTWRGSRRPETRAQASCLCAVDFGCRELMAELSLGSARAGSLWPGLVWPCPRAQGE